MPADRIDRKEFEKRYDRIRSFLQDQGLGALFVFSPPEAHQWSQTGHVSYLSGWADHDRIIDSAVVVPVKGDPVLMFAGLPYMREAIADMCPLSDVRLVRAVDPQAVSVATKGGSGPRAFVEETQAILEDNGLAGQAVGVVGIENMSVPFYESLANVFGDKLRRVADIVAELRSVKTPAEVDAMRQAARLSDLGYQTMLQVARSGMRGIEIVAEMEHAVRRQGADLAKYWMASGPPPDWANVKLEIRPHLRRLQEGDFVAACSYVLYKGYWCHGQRTGTLVKPSPDLNKIHVAARLAQDAGLQNIKPGEPISHFTKTIREKADELGLDIQGGRYGHGMGMDYSERPAVTESNDQPLEAGMTFVIHTTFGLRDSGKMFVPTGDVCHVTDDGVELLMDFTREPFVAGG